MNLLQVIETTSLRVFGSATPSKIFLPRIVDFITAEFQFVEYPKTAADFVGNDGLKFRYGAVGDLLVSEMILFNDAILMRCDDTSEALDTAFDTVVRETSSKFGLEIPADFQQLYNGKIEVQAVVGFAKLFEPLKLVIENLTEKMMAKGVDVTSYGGHGFTLSGEGELPIKPGRFVFEKRSERPTDSNIYFSEAPLSTPEHLSLLDELEKLF